MQLIDFERAILAGNHGEAAQRAIAQQIAVGDFFGAEHFVPVRSVHLKSVALEKQIFTDLEDEIARTNAFDAT